ncbi:MurR/RpiR family transcriptional regulator [Qiania dongpingensis]|uniref:MurR/RpiR family transcriptional regulator n=2 Tax=Qiania dongpingensis TaxID=2763669 RepID=A0A7G9G7P6_9FIRM|nr:MurR/RpiR family transcriptional regulator [Qiania dongpingensis]
MGMNDLVIDTIKENYQQMFSAEKKVADFILQNPERTVSANVSELAELSGVSDATVIRMCKHLGYQGFYQMKLNLARDLGQHQLVGYCGDQDNPDTAKAILQGIARNLLNTASKLDMNVILGCAKMIRESEMVHAVAVGNTSPVAIDLGFRLGRLGIRTSSALVPEYFLSNISLGSKKDVIVAISHSGSSRQVIQALELGRDKGMKSIAITGSARSPVSQIADYTLNIPVEDPLFSEFGAISHVYAMAVIDALLYFVANAERGPRDVDRLEMLLAEYKL